MSGVDRLLDRMRRSKAGWTFADLERLYVGLGFEIREGGKHRLYIHPKFPQLRATVTRSRSLAKGYIEHALDLAERLSKMETENGKHVNEYMSLPYSTVVVPDVTTDGEPCYMAYHPELEGCMSHGDTLEEALRNLSEVTRLYISALIDDGLEVPPPQLIDDGLEVPLPQGIMPNWEVVSPRTKHGEYVDLSPVITPP